MDELRLALRRLLARPAATLVSLATLASAIGATAVTWSALSAALIHPLPVKDPDRLVVVARERQGRSGPIVSTGLLYPKLQQIRESGAFVETVADWFGTHLLLVRTRDVPVRTDVDFVTHDYFDVLGVAAVLGREFVPDDDRRGAAPVAVLTHRYWRQTFDADPSVIGRTIQISGKTVTIVGVLRRGFRGLNLDERPDLYLAFHSIADVGGGSTNYFAEAGAPESPTSGTVVIGRLKAGTTAAEATARIAALDPPESRRPTDPRIVLLPSTVAAIPAAARPGMERFAVLLAGTVGLLLFIGCTTVGMLLLIRTEARREEFAMCMALGASRARLARGIAIEGMLLAAGGSILALPVAWWLFRLVRVFELPGNISIELLELSLDTHVVTGCVAAAIVAVWLISVVAGVFGFRADVADALRSRAGATPRSRRRMTRAALVGAQVAVALTLVSGAGLLARSLVAALRLNPGLDMSRITMTTIQLGSYGYTPERASEFFDALQARLGASPAIDRMAFSRWEGGMGSRGKIQIDGVPRQFPSLVSYIRVDPRFFPTMAIRLLEGRNFNAGDRPNAPPVAIVSESFGRMLANGASPIGSRLGGITVGAVPLEVVGVASDLVGDVTVLEPLVIYLPVSQGRPSVVRDLAVRATGGAAAAKAAIATAIKGIDRQVTPTPPRTLEERVAAQMGPQRLGATVLGALGAIAVLLTLLGTYVVAESMASLRTREMGIRAALGATRRQLGSIVLSDTLRLVGLGLAAGLGLAWLGTRTIRSFLFQVQPFDVMTIGSVAVLILLLAVAVSLRAAVRVARVDLAQVLRLE